MPTKVLECKKCHTRDQEKFSFDPSGRYFTCECGAKNTLYDSYEIVEINAEIDGIATVKNKIKRANQLIQEKNYDKAIKLYKEVLECNPESYEAWWGIYVAENAISAYYGYEDQYGNRGPAVKARIIAKNLEYANRAIEYAPDEVKVSYQNAIQGQVEFIQNPGKKNSNAEKKQGFFARLFGI